MKNAAAGLLVTLGLLVCSKAHAEPTSRNATSPTGHTLFGAADGDRNGRVSYRELATVVKSSIARRIQARFRQLDRNHDGLCTRREVNKMVAARFARFDLNGDGAFTLAELTHAMTDPVALRLHEVYARLDVDGDGALSMAELAPQPKQKAVAVARVSKDPGHKVAEVAKRTSTVQ
jgi:Ca2+-binding EF-hand superfamily protein